MLDICNSCTRDMSLHPIYLKSGSKTEKKGKENFSHRNRSSHQIVKDAPDPSKNLNPIFLPQQIIPFRPSQCQHLPLVSLWLIALPRRQHVEIPTVHAQVHDGRMVVEARHHENLDFFFPPVSTQKQ